MADLGEVATADDMTDEENWTGGFYELSLLLGAADDRRLDRPPSNRLNAIPPDGPYTARS